MYFARLANRLLKEEENAGNNHVLAYNFAKHSPLVDIFFTHTLSNKPLLIWLLATPSHQYASTLPSDLSFRACSADINVSQGSVATYARCGGVFNIHLTANLPRNLPVKYIFFKLVNI